MAYDVRLTGRARRQLEHIMNGLTAAERQRFREGFEALGANPYPTNNNVPPGSIKRLRGSSDWRYRITHRYRMTYSIEGQTVTVTRILHRRDVYRNA